MKTLFIRDAEPPHELRDLVRGGSTELTEVRRGELPPAIEADRVIVWDGSNVFFEDRRLRWPDDEDELRMLFQTGG